MHLMAQYVRSRLCLASTTVPMRPRPMMACRSNSPSVCVDRYSSLASHVCSCAPLALDFFNRFSAPMDAKAFAAATEFVFFRIFAANFPASASSAALLAGGTPSCSALASGDRFCLPSCLASSDITSPKSRSFTTFLLAPFDFEDDALEALGLESRLPNLGDIPSRPWPDLASLTKRGLFEGLFALALVVCARFSFFLLPHGAGESAPLASLMDSADGSGFFFLKAAAAPATAPPRPPLPAPPSMGMGMLGSTSNT
mmetsp:Transcript_2345/g.6994  ORF Transcript_2345/g.6994 Transcript_2345/m.6994 type:complete len:256 (-) Transcript_2345:266-1033(-)